MPVERGAIRTVFIAPLFRKSLLDHARNIVSWMSGVVILVVVQLSVYPTIRDSSAGWSDVTQDFPEVIKEMLRMSDYTSETGYLNTELMSFTLPFIFIMMGATWGARACTEDEEAGTADLLLSLPISRASYVLSRITAATTVVALSTLAFVVSLGVGARLLHMSIALSHFVACGLSLFLLGIISVAIAAAIGAATGRRGVALGATTALVIASFVLYSLAPLVTFFRRIEPWSLFRWTVGTQPLTNGFSVGYVTLSFTCSLVFCVMAAWCYRRRDIRV